ncbi:hypothetical protein G7046_g5491 [Stylonectria norvegica]|nr:hypothetical protein G7046_g5491 [Stylonectria norvegica]
MMDTEKGIEAHEAPQSETLCEKHEIYGKIEKLKSYFSTKRIIAGTVILVCMLAVMFGMGVLAARYEESDFHSGHVVVMAENSATQQAHGLVRRDEECTDSSAQFASDAAAATAGRFTSTSLPGAASPFVSVATSVSAVVPVDTAQPDARDNADAGAPIPISTQTELSTIYSLPTHSHGVTTKTETTTDVLTLSYSTSISALTFESSSEVCSMEVVTLTQSFTITVIPTPVSQAPGDATVTGNPYTVTDVQTDVSVSSGLPDATVSGNPETVTDLQTDLSITSGLPDATVSGNPETVTDLQTDVSVTGLPDATVSGNPSTLTNVQTDYFVSSGLPDATASGSPSTVTAVQTSISVLSSAVTSPTLVLTFSDLYPPASTSSGMSTITKVATVHKTVTQGGPSEIVVTVSNLYPQSSSSVVLMTSDAAGEAATFTSPSPTSTTTRVVTETYGSTSVSLTTISIVVPPYPSANGTASNYASGTMSTVPNPTTPVIISGGAQKPQPRGFGGSNGTTNLGCTIMLIAAVMFLL